MTTATATGEHAPAPPGRAGARWLAWLIVLVAAVGFLVLGGFEAWHDSATYDEPVYVSSGVAAVLHHDVADNAEHPPLFKVLAALPVLAVHPVVPADGHWNTNNERTYSARFVAAQLKAGTMHRVTFAARLVPLFECALAALVLFLLASTLFGRWAGVVAALLWLCDPVVLGIGHLDGVDLPFALTAALLALALVRWLAQRTRGSVVWVGVTAGLAVGAQSTGLVLAALAVVVVVVAQRRAGVRGWALCRPVVAVAVLAWLVVWASYVAVDPAVVLHPWGIFPHPYIDGLRYLGSHDTGGSPGFLLGQSWSGISLWFWPATVLVKLPAPLLLVLVGGTLALVALVRAGRVDRTTWRRTLVAVALPAVVLFVLELPNPKTLGVRYLLPSLALWAVVASPIALLVGRRLVAGALGLLLAVAAGELVSSYPHSIATSAAPFRPAYRVATDSNVDWGQDLGALMAWSPAHHPYVAYFGPRGVTVGDIPDARALVGRAPQEITGWVAASASDLTSADRTQLSWLRAYCPVGTLGGSILLYHFVSPPSGGSGPATPAPLCAGAVSHRVAGG